MQSHARFTLAEPMPRLCPDAVGGESGSTHPMDARPVRCRAGTPFTLADAPAHCRCPMPDHPPCQIIPHPLAQSASAPGSRKIFYDSLFKTLRLAALIEWETEIRQAGEAVLFYLENYENNALGFSHGFAVDFETLKKFRR